MSVTFTCDLHQTPAALAHYWEHTVGSGHAPLALRSDYEKQLRRCHDELGFRHVRFHSILSDQMGTMIINENRPLYSFLNTDRIMDVLIEIGMKPLVELSFMPPALASGNQTVFHYQANVTAPRDYQQWETLIDKLVRHWIDRYGLDEVRSWPMEVWNEPNMPSFWPGGQKEYFKLYRHTVTAVKNVDAALTVGGPVTAHCEWIEPFLEFANAENLPVDFVSTHLYPTDAAENQKQDIRSLLADGRRGFMTEKARDVARQAQGRPVYFTEWSSSSSAHDPLHDEPYAAAFLVKTVMDTISLVECYSWWTFTDIFAENYFPSEPYHGGFGLMNLYGIPKPTYRAFELLHHLGQEILRIDGIHRTMDAWVTRGDGHITILMTNHALPRHRISAERVTVQLQNVPNAPICSYLQRIDAEHAHPKSLWQAIGSPRYPKKDQVALLEQAAAVSPAAFAGRYNEGSLSFELDIPPHAVAAITIQFAPDRDRAVEKQ
jgi:xylan 1,4-beta-xylosidase